MSRQWTDLRDRLRSGEGHGETLSGKSGSLALQCMACPQPGFNLPTDWKKDKDQCDSSLPSCTCDTHHCKDGFIDLSFAWMATFIVNA